MTNPTTPPRGPPRIPWLLRNEIFYDLMIEDSEPDVTQTAPAHAVPPGTDCDSEELPTPPVKGKEPLTRFRATLSGM